MRTVFKINITRYEWITLFLTAILTAIASEVKVIPFNGEAFRFGLGSITFFLLILIRPPASILRTGIVTGLAVVLFRILAETAFDPVPLWTSFQNHLPAFLFYSLYGLGFSLIKIDEYKTAPLLLGTFAAVFEFTANGAEHIMRYLLPAHANLELNEWAILLGVALLRSFFVVGLYSSITVSEQKKRMEEMLGVGSELYTETLYLQKSMDHIEQITASSHDLYRKLKKKDLKELSVQALLIAQEIHEVKKDSQRILSGLSKITIQKENHAIFLSDVLDFVIHGNEKYARMLGKTITIELTSDTDFETNQQIPLLALLNNVTANSVEAIAKTGTIEITVSGDEDFTAFTIKDSGKGIPAQDLPIIFDPGFTTKFNDHGVAATGIGLSHVQTIVDKLNGQIAVESQADGAIFKISIPTKNIQRRGE